MFRNTNAVRLHLKMFVSTTPKNVINSCAVAGICSYENVEISTVCGEKVQWGKIFLEKKYSNIQMN